MLYNRLVNGQFIAELYIMISDRDTSKQLEQKHPHLFDSSYGNYFIRTQAENRSLRRNFVDRLAADYNIRLDQRDGLPVNCVLSRKIVDQEATQNLMSALFSQSRLEKTRRAANGWQPPNPKALACEKTRIERQMEAGGYQINYRLVNLGREIEAAKKNFSKPVPKNWLGLRI
jgi:hypothetical protein